MPVKAGHIQIECSKYLWFHQQEPNIQAVSHTRSHSNSESLIIMKIFKQRITTLAENNNETGTMPMRCKTSHQQQMLTKIKC